MSDPANYCSWLIPSLCATQSEWAAWAQAVMSALAIWYSGRLAFNQSRAAKREKVQTYVRIIAIASQEAEHAVNLLQSACARGAAAGGDLYGFESLGANLRAIQFHDAPDHRLVSIIRDAADACQMLDTNCDKIMNTGIAVSRLNLIDTEEGASILLQCFMDAADISIELLPWHRRVVMTALKTAFSRIRSALKRHDQPPESHAG